MIMKDNDYRALKHDFNFTLNISGEDKVRLMDSLRRDVNFFI